MTIKVRRNGMWYHGRYMFSQEMKFWFTDKVFEKLDKTTKKMEH